MKTLAALVAAIFLLAALAMFAPAALLDGRLAAATDGKLRLAQASGTLWNGRGQVTGAQRSWSLPLAWTLDPRSVLRGEPAITLRPTEGGDTPRGEITLRDGAVALDAVAWTLPAATLDGLFSPGGALAFGGVVAFEAPSANWSEKGGGGAATLRWNAARVASAMATVALGDVTVNFAPRDGAAVGRVGNSGGELRLEGEIVLRDANVAVDLTVAALPSTPPAVARAMVALGTPDGKGGVRLQWRSAPPK